MPKVLCAVPITHSDRRYVKIGLPVWRDKDNCIWPLTDEGQYHQLYAYYEDLGYEVWGYFDEIGFYDESPKMTAEFRSVVYNCKVEIHEV